MIPCFCRQDLTAAHLPGPAGLAGAALPVAVFVVVVELLAELPHAASVTQVASTGSASAGRKRRLLIR